MTTFHQCNDRSLAFVKLYNIVTLAQNKGLYRISFRTGQNNLFILNNSAIFEPQEFTIFPITNIKPGIIP